MNEQSDATAAITEDEADEIDRAMNEHMYQHSIANNINAMSCGVRCRTNAIRRVVNAVLAERDTRVIPPRGDHE
jgi:hypothetical protein